MSQAQLETKVEDYLRKSQMLEDHWQRPITAEQLQAEMDRMAKHTKQPEVLRELFKALGNDPFAIAECLARPALAELVTSCRRTAHATNGGIASQRGSSDTKVTTRRALAIHCRGYRTRRTDAPMTLGQLPARPTRPAPETEHTAVWTGTEMIVWGASTAPTF